MPDINFLRSEQLSRCIFFVCAIVFFINLKLTEKRGGGEPQEGGVQHISRSRYEPYVKEHIETQMSSKFRPSM